MEIKDWARVNPGTVVELADTEVVRQFVFDGFFWRLVGDVRTDGGVAQWEMKQIFEFAGAQPDKEFIVLSEGVERLSTDYQ